jgi:hypothetical protein
MPRKELICPCESAAQVEVTISIRKRPRSATAEELAVRPEASHRIPRIARLMAMAIKFQDLVDRGQVRDYADLASLGSVTRARVTQIMNLLLLAPQIQEILLFHLQSGEYIHHREICERDLRSIASMPSWTDQIGSFERRFIQAGHA